MPGGLVTIEFFEGLPGFQIGTRILSHDAAGDFDR